MLREVVDGGRVEPERPGDQPVLDVGDEVVDLVAQLRGLLGGADHDQGDQAAEEHDRHQDRRQGGRTARQAPPAQKGQERMQQRRDEQRHQERDDHQAEVHEQPEREVPDRPDHEQPPGVIAGDAERPAGVGPRRRLLAPTGLRCARPCCPRPRRRHGLQPARPGPGARRWSRSGRARSPDRGLVRECPDARGLARVRRRPIPVRFRAGPAGGDSGRGGGRPGRDIVAERMRQSGANPANDRCHVCGRRGTRTTGPP